MGANDLGRENAAGSQHPQGLGQDAPAFFGLGEVIERTHHQGGVAGGIVSGERSGIAQLDLEGLAARRTIPGRLDVALRRIDLHDVVAHLGQVLRMSSRTATHVDDTPGGGQEALENVPSAESGQRARALPQSRASSSVLL